MNPQHAAQAFPADPEQSQGDSHVVGESGQSSGLGYWPLSREFPALLTAADLRVVFGSARGPMSVPTYHRRRALGHFKRFAVESLGGVRYSGAKVRAFVLGEALSNAVTFGGKRGPRKLVT